MNPKLSHIVRWGVLLAVLVGLPCAAYFSRSLWYPLLKSRLEASQKAARAGEHDHGEVDAHNHDHAGHDDANSLELSEQARRALGLEPKDLQTIKLVNFERMLTIPALIVERPGRSQFQVTAPMTGIVTRIHPLRGEAVQPGELLFEIRLTHEELVQSQAEYLRTAEELDVIEREVKRLEKVVEGGAVAGKQLLERQYEQQKLLAIGRAQRQALLLHGISEPQADEILKSRKLLGTISVSVPKVKETMSESNETTFFRCRNCRCSRGST